jgi:hypothetical protein
MKLGGARTLMLARPCTSSRRLARSSNTTMDRTAVVLGVGQSRGSALVEFRTSSSTTSRVALLLMTLLLKSYIARRENKAFRR